MGTRKEAKAIERDWEVVGSNLNQAMLETAERLGGTELLEDVTWASIGEGPLPDPKALEILEAIRPGIAEDVFSRMKQIGEETRLRELAESSSFKHRAINIGKDMMRILG